MRLFSIGFSMLLLSACSDDPLQESNPTGPSGEPDIIELGLRLIPEGVDLHLSELSAAETGPSRAVRISSTAPPAVMVVTLQKLVI
jgi:hypothetical protein